jgi:HSP20 family protein
MSTMMRYDPFREMLSLRKAMDQLFEQSFVRPTWGTASTQGVSVPMNVYQDEQGYHIQALLPGVNPENVELSVQQNTLTIQGQFQPATKPDQQVNWLLQEIGYGSFERSITFPQEIDVDRITTSYEQGVLTISVPISEAGRPKKISIAGAQPKQMTVEAGAH